MAGDWIKVQKDTPEKPEVQAIAFRLGIDPDAVVGKLVRVWSWFDTHTKDGNAQCVTFALLDRLTSVTGFAEHMKLVGWLDTDGVSLILPNFNFHNGATAKTRANGKNRSEKHRSNADTVTESVTEPSPEKRREEKRREEEIKTGEKQRKRRTQLAADFYPTETGVTAIEPTGLSMAVELEKFRNHHAAKGSVMADWQAAWRTWVGNAVKFSSSHRSTGRQAESFAERDERQARERWEEATGKRTRTVIDITPANELLERLQ